MGKTIAIITSAVVFALLGLGCSIIGVLFCEETRGEERLLLTFIPPAVGGGFGLIVGCIATVVGGRSPTTKAA